MPSKSSAMKPNSLSTNLERPEKAKERRSQAQFRHRENLFEEFKKLKYVRPEIVDWPPELIQFEVTTLHAMADTIVEQIAKYEKLLETQDKTIQNLRTRLRLANQGGKEEYHS